MAMSSTAFDQLLVALHPDRDLAGDQYRQLHHRLVRFFEWQASTTPEAYADEVMDRIVRRISSGESIANLPAYAHGVAKLVALEMRKTRERERVARAELRYVNSHELTGASDDDEPDRQRLCFDRCLQTIEPSNREMILAYYSGEGHTKIEGRRQLATRLGTDMNALRVRAHRIRTQLEQCVGGCVQRRSAQ
jgi:DNA-directed RNA polymerase specialized sigma24 family protein